MVKGIAGELPASLEVLMAQLQAMAGHDTSERLGRSIRSPRWWSTARGTG